MKLFDSWLAILLFCPTIISPNAFAGDPELYQASCEGNLLMVNAELKSGTIAKAKDLICASSQAHLDVIQALVASGLPVDAQVNSDTYPASYAAIYSKKPTALKMLLNLQANPNFIYQQFTPLTFSVEYSTPEIAEILLENGADPNLGDPVLYASQNDETGEFVAALVKHHADINGQTHGSFGLNSGHTPVMEAAWYQHLASVETLIHANAELDHQSGDLGDTALMLALWNRNFTIANALISAGANLNLVNFKGEVAADFVLSSRYIEELKLLIAKGADLSHGTQDRIAVALSDGSPELLDLVVQAKANLNQAYTDACQANRFNLFPYFLKLDAPINGGNDASLENMALTCAIAQERPIEMTQFLLDHGASANGGSFPPLENAIFFGRPNEVPLLIKAGANVHDHESFQGDGYIAQIVQSRYSDDLANIFKQLIAAKVDPNEANKYFILPLSKVADPRWVDLLVASGADINKSSIDDPAIFHIVRRAPFGDLETQVLKAFIRNGANLKLTGHGGGKTVCDSAQEAGNLAALAILMSAGGCH